MKLKKWELALIFAVIAAVVFSAVLSSQQTRLSEKLIRLHVVADSDDADAQEAKLAARDAVLNKLSKRLDGVTGPESAARVIESCLGELEEAASIAGGYEARATLEREYFPTRDYDDFSLPAGEYMSLRVVLGEGEGRNWWCVVFPPLCFGAIEQSEAETELTEEELSLITEDSPEYVVKFKLIELIGELKRRIFG